MKRIFILFLFFILAGCATTSPRLLERDIRVKLGAPSAIKSPELMVIPLSGKPDGKLHGVTVHRPGGSLIVIPPNMPEKVYVHELLHDIVHQWIDINRPEAEEAIVRALTRAYENGDF